MTPEATRVLPGSMLAVRAAPARDRHERIRMAGCRSVRSRETNEAMRECQKCWFRRSGWKQAQSNHQRGIPRRLHSMLPGLRGRPGSKIAARALAWPERGRQYLSGRQNGRGAGRQNEWREYFEGSEPMRARVGTARAVEADPKRCSHAEAMKRNARKATAYVTKSRSGDAHQKFEWRDTGENKP
jgi:hypothetical protein